MKNCVVCFQEFYARHIGKTCSLKCKIFDGIQKQDNGCWLYKNATSGQYSKIRWNKKWYLAHRISYETFVGPIDLNKWVCHKCDTPKCVNPDHLFLGSASDNRRDAVNKKRTPFGEKNHFSRFTDIQVEEMKLLRSEGFTYLRLSKIFNCSFTYIYKVLKNQIRK